MADNIAPSLPDVNAGWLGRMFEAFIELFRPVCKIGEMYSRDQVISRLGVGDKQLKSWVDDHGLQVWTPPGSSKQFYKGEELIDFVGKFPRLDKTE